MIAATLTVLLGVASSPAEARRVHSTAGPSRHAAASATLVHATGKVRHGGTYALSKRRFGKNAKARYTRYAGLQCVPFARAASGIELKGNAANWWDAAAGVYERGSEPETGSVLNFRSTGHMRLGHVAVVTRTIGPREIEIEHANWAGPGANKGGVSRGIPVQDVSENNDWSAVRVGLGRSGDFGSVYPTYGFIYDRPDRGAGTMLASTGRRRAYDEVAEAPNARAVRPILIQGLDGTLDRNLR